MRRRALAAMGLALTACVGTETAPAPAPAPTTNAPAAPAAAEPASATSEVEELLADHRKAMDAYIAPYKEAKTDEEREKLAPLRWEDDPNLLFRAKFQAVAAKAAGQEAGLTANLWIFEHRTRDLGAGREEALHALDEIMAHHATSPRLEEFARSIQHQRWILPRDVMVRTLRTLIATNPHPPVRGAAILSLANMFSGEWPPDDAHHFNMAGAVPDEWDEAGALLQAAVKDCAGTPWSARAAGLLRQRSGLQTGMTAPDFEATDAEGATFRLSDYRGKVVVLDFWGFG